MANIKTDEEYCEENRGKRILNIFLLSNSVRKLRNKYIALFINFFKLCSVKL